MHGDTGGRDVEGTAEEVVGMSLHCRAVPGGRSPTDLAGDLVSESNIQAPSSDALLKIPQVAERLNVSRNTVYRLIADGELPVVTVGATSRVDPKDLDAYIARNKQSA